MAGVYPGSQDFSCPPPPNPGGRQGVGYLRHKWFHQVLSTSCVTAQPGFKQALIFRPPMVI